MSRSYGRLFKRLAFLYLFLGELYDKYGVLASITRPIWK